MSQILLGDFICVYIVNAIFYPKYCLLKKSCFLIILECFFSILFCYFARFLGWGWAFRNCNYYLDFVYAVRSGGYLERRRSMLRPPWAAQKLGTSLFVTVRTCILWMNGGASKKKESKKRKKERRKRRKKTRKKIRKKEKEERWKKEERCKKKKRWKKELR